MARKKNPNPEEQNNFVAYSGSAPTPVSAGQSNESYTSADGTKVYVQFIDVDSNGLYPSSGTHLRFSVTKVVGGLATTVTPTSTFIDSNLPKTLQLTLNSSDRIIDGLYNGSGIVTSYQSVFVNYTNTTAGGFGTIPLLSDNDTIKTNVQSFAGLAVSNRTSEANGPQILYAFSSTDGRSINAVFREASRPLLPTSGIAGFAVTQGTTPITISSAYVSNPSSATGGTIVVLELSNPLSISTGSNLVTLSYTWPTLYSTRLRDSSALGNTAVAFSGLAVTNLTSETTAPRVVDAYTSDYGVRLIYVKMSEPSLPGESGTGFSVAIGSSSFPASIVIADNSTYAGQGVTEYTMTISHIFNDVDILELDYHKFDTNFITDQSANLNPLATFSNKFRIRNLYSNYNPLSPEVSNVFNAEESYVDTNGLDIYLSFDINKYFETYPDTDIEGLQVYVDGQLTPVKKAISLDRTFLPHVKLTLYHKIFLGSEVKVGFIQGNLRDSNLVIFANFEPGIVANNSSIDPPEFFDVLTWFDNTNESITYEYDIDDNVSELFRKSKINTNTSVVLDTVAPQGVLILNRSENDLANGIRIHKFSAYGTEEIEYNSTTSDVDLRTFPASFSISSAKNKSINKLIVKLKLQYGITNTHDSVRITLHSNNIDSDVPGELLFSLGKISFGSLESIYQEFEISFDSIEILANTIYWIQITCDNIIDTNINNPAAIYISKHTSIGKYFAVISAETSTGWLVNKDTSVYYKLFSADENDLELSSNDLILDIFEKPIRKATYFTDISLRNYELIGDKQSNFLLKRLSKVQIDGLAVYPYVSKVVLGATSTKPKNYILEVRTDPESSWKKVYDTIVDETTLDNLVYTFTNPVQISDIRLVYKGDYFTIDSVASLTLAANDNFSDVVSAQISHFPDFRDAKSFILADSNGYFDFSEGVTTYLDYVYTNNAEVFEATTSSANSEILTSLSYNGKIILGANNTAFSFYNGVTSAISNSNLVDNNVQITCSAVYKNKIYIGATNGLLFASITGDYWNIVNPVNPNDPTSYKTIKPIVSMKSMGDKLYIGTEKGSSIYPSVYSYDGKSIIKIKDFDSTFQRVSSLGSCNFTLFAGLGGLYASANSTIYKYDENEWISTLATTYDDIEALEYSTARSSLIAGFRGGFLWELPYVNSLPTSWSQVYDTNADHIYSINDDTNGEYLFVNTDVKSVMYVKSLNSFKSVDTYHTQQDGINLRWRKFDTYAESYSSDLADNENFTYQNYSFLSTSLDSANFTKNGFSSNSSVLVEGYIKIKTDGDYKFKLTTNMGAKFYISTSAVVSDFSTINKNSETNLITPSSYVLKENDLVYVKIEAFVSASTTPTIHLYWNNLNDIYGYEIIPAAYLKKSSKVKSILEIDEAYYGVGSDGVVYTFDPTYYATKVKNVYARIKDSAGNIHGLALSGKSEVDEILSDKIVQDLNTVEGTYQTKGKIFQVLKNADNTLQTRVVYTPNTRQYSIYAPDRKVRETGYYEAEPFFVPTLVKWSNLVVLVANKYSINTFNGTVLSGLDAGTAVKVYVRTGASRSECLLANWSTAYEISYINVNTSIPPIETLDIALQAYNGKWLQYKFELISATKNVSPEIISTTISYSAGTSSYYFTKIFDTADYVSTSPVIRRGLLTSNELLNNGTITYGYINSDNVNDIYDFNKYKQITPNEVFTIDSPTSQIKFGILFTSVGNNPSVVYDFAVQLDLGGTNVRFMPSL
jgi:hypothetical protein